MSITTKTFLSLALVAVVTCAMLTFAIYEITESSRTHGYVRRYQTLGEMIAGMFQQMEQSTDRVNRNALRVLYEIERAGVLPSDPELDALARELAVTGFYATDDAGRFVRSSDFPVEEQENSLFDYCSDYRQLIGGRVGREETPVLGSSPLEIPAKFTMISNSAGTMILEVKTELSYISKTLRDVVDRDPAVLSVGLYSPTGTRLGSVQPRAEGVRSWPAEWRDSLFGHRFLDDTVAVRVRVPATVEDCCECRQKGQIGVGESYHYALQMQIDLGPLHRELDVARRYAALALLLAGLAGVLAARVLSRKLTAGLASINRTAKSIIESRDLDLRVDIPTRGDEVGELASTFNRMVASLKSAQEDLIEAEKARAHADLASQVAHDIRSPVAALVGAVDRAPNLPDEWRSLIRDAVSRIVDTANGLLRARRRNSPRREPALAARAHEPVLATLLSLMAEKRVQYVRKGDVFDVQLADELYSTFVEIDRSCFSRALSNLIDNAVEAIRDEGTVVVRARKKLGFMLVEIIDSGCGMSEEMVQAIVDGRVVAGKPQGNGLGLVGASRASNGAGGRLTVASKVGVGTRVSVLLPISAPPAGFPLSVQARRSSVVVTLDDDPSITGLWQQRFRSEVPDTDDVRLRAFQCAAIFANDVRERNGDVSAFLLDYEIRGCERTGVQLAVDLGITDRTVIVTGHDDAAVREACEKAGVAILPKCLAQYVPLRIHGHRADQLP
jgi:signal transduction histidine kinase